MEHTTIIERKWCEEMIWHAIDDDITRGIDDNGLKYQALISVLWNTGHRISEVLLLKRSDVWYDDNWVWFRYHVLKKYDKKTGEQREYIHTIKVPKKASFVSYIIKYIDSLNEPDELLFNITRQYVDMILKQLCEKLEYPKISAHDFRHTLATRLAERGANKYEMDAFFGWTGWDTSSVYVQKGTALIENIASKID